jgi:hypothetical protein
VSCDVGSLLVISGKVPANETQHKRPLTAEEVAELHGVSTGRFNEAVKRNRARLAPLGAVNE